MTTPRGEVPRKAPASAASAPPTSASTLRRRWLDHAFRNAGIDASQWDPTHGVAENRQTIECVTDIYVVTEHKVVLLADFTDLVAYGQAGKLWSSGRLAWDDLKIVGVNGSGIEMTGFHAPRNDPRYPFTVDLSTGESDTKPYDW